MTEVGDELSMTTAVTSSLGWIKDAMEIFTTAPAIYFVGFAVIAAAAGVARKFVPMKRR